MMTRKKAIFPVDINPLVLMPTDWLSRSRKLSPGLIQAAKFASQQSESDLGCGGDSVQILAQGEKA